LSRSVIRWEYKKEEKTGFQGKRYGTVAQILLAEVAQFGLALKRGFAKRCAMASAMMNLRPYQAISEAEMSTLRSRSSTRTSSMEANRLPNSVEFGRGS
jgi:hypothetical protein